MNARIVEDALAAERATPAVEIGETAAESSDSQSPVEASSDSEPSSSTESDDEDEPPLPPNQGQLILDAASLLVATSAGDSGGLPATVAPLSTPAAAD